MIEFNRTYNPVFDTHPFNAFVLPGLCHQLQEAGIKLRSKYWYALTDNVSVLKTNLFDPDRYYSQAEKAIETAMNCQIVPALLGADLFKLLPDYTILKNNNRYEMLIDRLYYRSDSKGIPGIQISARRMADLPAVMMMELVSSGKIPALWFVSRMEEILG